MEIAYKISKPLKGLFGGLGWKFIISGDRKTAPPPTSIAASIVLLFNSVGIVFGVIVLVASIGNFLIPSFAVDALLAKNAIYFFEHVFINAKIYMAIKALYELVPEYTGKPWKTPRLFAIAWAALVILVQAVYFRHLVQDMTMPEAELVPGQRAVVICTGAVKKILIIGAENAPIKVENTQSNPCIQMASSETLELDIAVDVAAYQDDVLSLKDSHCRVNTLHLAFLRLSRAPPHL